RRRPTGRPARRRRPAQGRRDLGRRQRERRGRRHRPARRRRGRAPRRPGRRPRPAAGAAAAGDALSPRQGRATTGAGWSLVLPVVVLLRRLVIGVAAVVMGVVIMHVVVIRVIAAAVGGAGAGPALRLVALLRPGEVLHRRGGLQDRAVLEGEGERDLVARQQRGDEVHEHQMVPSGRELERAAGGQREAALLLLHAHAARAIRRRLVQLHLLAGRGGGAD